MSPTPLRAPDDPALSALLHDTVDDVVPVRGLDEVLRRAHEEPAPRRTPRAVVAGTVALATAASIAAVAAGAGVFGPDVDTAPGPATSGPTASASAPPTTGTSTDLPTPRPASDATDQPVADLQPFGPSVTGAYAFRSPVWFVRDRAEGPRLLALPRPAGSAVDARSALRSLLDGPPEGSGLRSPWPAGIRVRSARIVGEGGVPYTYVVDLAADGTDLTARPAGGDPGDGRLAAQQMAWTLRGLASYARLELRVDGRPVTSLLGDPIEDPVRADTSLLAPVQLGYPYDGPLESRRVRILAAAREAGPLPWALVDAAGEEVRSGTLEVEPPGGRSDSDVGVTDDGSGFAVLAGGLASRGLAAGAYTLRVGDGADAVTRAVTVP